MEPLVIATSLNSQQNAVLEAHRSVHSIIELSEKPWLVPLEAEALFTYQTQWRDSPASPPPGWPYKLKWIQIASAGADTFPYWIHQVPLVTRGRGVQAPAIAEFVIGTIYAHEKRIWDGPVRSAQAWHHKMLGSVQGKTLGIAGMGAIGKLVAQTALAVGMKVCALTRTSKVSLDGVETVNSLDNLGERSDHLVVALPLTTQTRRIFNSDFFKKAKPGLHIINVARGALIDDQALIAALDAGYVGAATLDVTDPEPLPSGHALYNHPKIRLTPHVSGMSEQAETRLSDLLKQNIDTYVAGDVVSGVVQPDRGY
jgi:phosphoglycerate dehydrogenase-like enzyme|tara:strand:+ start:45466 stop:46404 length:939 start_codon:yes stop_codon:yes gene_type:complete